MGDRWSYVGPVPGDRLYRLDGFRVLSRRRWNMADALLSRAGNGEHHLKEH
jgi:hypothetical protein